MRQGGGFHCSLVKLSADNGIQAAFFWSVRGTPQCARRDQLHWLFLCGLQQRCRPATAGGLLRDWFSPGLAVHESMGDSDAAGCRTSRPCVQVLLLCCFNFAAVAPRRPATVELLNRLTPPLIQSQLQGVPAWWQHWHLRACVAATSDNCARNGTDHSQGSRIKEDPVSARESTRHVSSTNSYSAWCHRLRPERPPPTAFGQRHYCQRRAAAETTIALFRRQQASDLIGAVFVQRACQSVCCVG